VRVESDRLNRLGRGQLHSPEHKHGPALARDHELEGGKHFYRSRTIQKRHTTQAPPNGGPKPVLTPSRARRPRSSLGRPVLSPAEVAPEGRAASAAALALHEGRPAVVQLARPRPVCAPARARVLRRRWRAHAPHHEGPSVKASLVAGRPGLDYLDRGLIASLPLRPAGLAPRTGTQPQKLGCILTREVEDDSGLSRFRPGWTSLPCMWRHGWTSLPCACG
jgi:hypothetical protein